MRKKIYIFSLLFLHLSAPCIYSQNTVPQKPADGTILESGKTIESEISGKQKHGYQIKLSANQYVKILVEQRGVDVGIRLFGTDGKSISDFDAEMRPNGIELIEFIADAEGQYRLDVSAKYPLLPAGKYEINFVEARAATEQDKSLQEARNLYAESLRLFNSGKYAESQTLVERAIEIRRKESGLENPLTASALTQLARLLDAQAKYDEAEQVNRQVLSIREKILGADHPDVGYTLNYLALNYAHKDDFQQAINFHQRALGVREKAFGQAHALVAVSLINLGVVYDALGDKIKALELYQRALKIQEQTVGAETVNTAVILNNIGKIYNDLNEFQKAEPFLLRAVQTLEKLLPNSPRIYDPMLNLAFSYAGIRDFNKAETLYLRVLEAREKSVGANHPFTAQTAYNLANLYSLKNDFERAEPLYRRALQVHENTLGSDSPYVGEDLNGLALMLARKGDINQAIALQQRASEIYERNISLNLLLGSERQKLAYLGNLFEPLNQSIFLQTHFAKDNALAVELAATTVLRQKGRVSDAVSNNLIELRRRFNEQDKTLLDNLSDTTRKISELILTGPEDEPVAEHQAKIKTLFDEREKLEDQISQRAAGFYVKSQPVSLPAIQALIPPDSVLVEFTVYTPGSFDMATGDADSYSKPRYAVYILRNKGEVKWKELGEAEAIDEAISAYRQSLRDPKRKDVQTLARRVDEKIMQPIRELLGDVKHLLISPDGELNLIPFEALVDEQGNLLIENHSFTYLTSGRDLLRMQTSRASKSKPLVIADPVFGSPAVEKSLNGDAKTKTSVSRDKRRSVTVARDLSDTYFAPLSGTAQEARSIQSVFPEATFLTGALATESVLKEVSAPQILHIATHGFFLQDKKADSKSAIRGLNAAGKIENPLLRSGLALAGANHRRGKTDDGVLTALEATGLNLWGTKLVVLSACDTGLGEVKNGEGVYGLRRAFVLAGAESLVMSLWSISDYATRELMTNYYKNLKQGMGRGAALRQVQLEMLKRKERRHPFFWAGFIQSGEWANLDGKR